MSDGHYSVLCLAASGLGCWGDSLDGGLGEGHSQVAVFPELCVVHALQVKQTWSDISATQTQQSDCFIHLLS